MNPLPCRCHKWALLQWYHARDISLVLWAFMCVQVGSHVATLSWATIACPSGLPPAGAGADALCDPLSVDVRVTLSVAGKALHAHQACLPTPCPGACSLGSLHTRAQGACGTAYTDVQNGQRHPGRSDSGEADQPSKSMRCPSIHPFQYPVPNRTLSTYTPLDQTICPLPARFCPDSDARMCWRSLFVSLTAVSYTRLRRISDSRCNKRGPVDLSVHCFAECVKVHCGWLHRNGVFV